MKFQPHNFSFLDKVSRIARARAWVSVFRVSGDAPVEREEERRQGREALRLLCAEMGEVEPREIEFPHPQFSLSHTASFRVVFGLKPNASVQGVGIDVELKRSMSPRMEKFFLTPEEAIGVGPFTGSVRETELLRLWTVKEALFKSDPGNSGHVLSHYRILSLSAVQGTAERRESSNVFWYASEPFEGGWLSVALCLKSSERLESSQLPPKT